MSGEQMATGPVLDSDAQVRLRMEVLLAHQQSGPPSVWQTDTVWKQQSGRCQCGHLTSPSREAATRRSEWREHVARKLLEGGF